MYEKIRAVRVRIWDKFTKGVNLKKEEQKQEDISEELLMLISEAKENLDAARHNFNYATDDRLLECRIFELKAAESRLGYFLKMAKDNNVTNPSVIFNSSEEGSACL